MNEIAAATRLNPYVGFPRDLIWVADLDGFQYRYVATARLTEVAWRVEIFSGHHPLGTVIAHGATTGTPTDDDATAAIHAAAGALA